MDNIGSNAFGDDWVTDVQTTLGVFITPGQVVGVSFSPPLPNGISELYIQFEGLSLPWDEKLEITGLLAAPVTTVTYTLYQDCDTAVYGVSIVDPDDTSTARLPAPEVEVENKINTIKNINTNDKQTY